MSPRQLLERSHHVPGVVGTVVPRPPAAGCRQTTGPDSFGHGCLRSCTAPAATRQGHPRRTVACSNRTTAARSLRAPLHIDSTQSPFTVSRVHRRAVVSYGREADRLAQCFVDGTGNAEGRRDVQPAFSNGEGKVFLPSSCDSSVTGRSGFAIPDSPFQIHVYSTPSPPKLSAPRSTHVPPALHLD